MSRYYYDTSESIYTSWDESRLKEWLVEHNVITSNAQLTREKLLKLVSDNYANAQDTIWGGASDVFSNRFASLLSVGTDANAGFACCTQAGGILIFETG
jgi:Putative nuclear envelope organisation protein